MPTPLVIAIRTDASLDIGTGHVMRCLTLAQRFKEDGSIVVFIFRDLPGHLGSLIEQRGFRACMLDRPKGSFKVTDGVVAHSAWVGGSWEIDAEKTRAVLSGLGRPDWFIIDHYALEARWEGLMRAHVGKIMAIDDLANRPHDADILLDQNLAPGYMSRYDTLVPASCRLLLGPKYALLRKEFVEARRYLRERDGPCRHLLVFMGGADAENVTSKVLHVFARLKRPGLAADIVLGPSNPFQKEIKQLCKSLNGVTVHTNVERMSGLMAKADIAIGAAGTTTWERGCLGLPSLTLNIASNQDPVAVEAEREGLLINLGPASDVPESNIQHSLERLLQDSTLRHAMTRRGMEMVDGLGVERVRAAMQ